MSSEEVWLQPKPVTPLAGKERFGEDGPAVSEFWSFAFSDLRENITRGVLAEFLVARAVGADQPVRSAWDNFDVLAPDGTRIEVKSSAYLQSWPQKRLSTITFTGLSARSWDGRDTYSAEREYRADVYVFCVHTCQDPQTYDPLSLDQWEFCLLPAAVVREHGTRSVGLGFLRRARAEAEAVGYYGLAAAIAEAPRART